MAIKTVFIMSLCLMMVYSKKKKRVLDEHRALFSKNHMDKYLWGTYKPNLYFALREKKNTSDVFGIMWYGLSKRAYKKTSDIKKRLRHECKEEDKVVYYWKTHNGLDYGNEMLIDNANNLELNPRFIKTNYTSSQEWVVNLKGRALKEKNQKEIGLILYFALEEHDIKDKFFFKANKTDNYNYELKGFRYGKEYSKIKITLLKGKENLKYSSYQKYRKAYTSTWRVKSFVEEELAEQENYFIKEKISYSYIPFKELGITQQPNVVAVQLFLSIQDAFEILVQYTTNDNFNPINFDSVSSIKEKEFDKKFFKHFSARPTKENISIRQLEDMSEEGISDILGGIGYFYGSIKVDNRTGETVDPNVLEPKELLTGTPCRSAFARGFEWDEGFHNILIAKWDIHLSMEIINSWFDTMSSEGWIPREQIRGGEQVAQVPANFIKQDPKIANPPTFIFQIQAFINYYKYNGESDEEINVKELLTKFSKKLALWYEFYSNTQRGDGKDNFQWYGRNSDHNFASGLDDLPRGIIPNADENHLDLNIWMLELLKTLRNLHEILNTELKSHYDGMIIELEKSINKKLYDTELGIYSDYLGVQPSKLRIRKFPRKVFPHLWRNDGRCRKDDKNPIGTPAECNPYGGSPCCSEYGWCSPFKKINCFCPRCKVSQKLEDREGYSEEPTYNPHIGYINLFPIIFGFAEEKTLKNILEFLGDPKELMSKYGIRSLSKSDPLYHTGDDYWRGHIWVPLNYLILRGMKVHYGDNEEVMQIYNRARDGLIKAVYNTWAKTHTFYEQYNDENGFGRKNKPFNGWTTMIVDIISENYDF